MLELAEWCDAFVNEYLQQEMPGPLEIMPFWEPVLKPTDDEIIRQAEWRATIAQKETPRA